jgi:CRP-like cAMP-binding protein
VTTSADVLLLTEQMPERHLAAGEQLIRQGDTGEVAVAVLVDGALDVEFGGAVMSSIEVPGTFIGELAALLHTARSASVVARTPATVRMIGDPDLFFETNPEVALELARQLAGRLHRLSAYLGDLRSQYADQEGHLSMVDSVLGRIASRPPVDIEPGSDRSPDY